MRHADERNTEDPRAGSVFGLDRLRMPQMQTSADCILRTKWIAGLPGSASVLGPSSISVECVLNADGMSPRLAIRCRSPTQDWARSSRECHDLVILWRVARRLRG